MGVAETYLLASVKRYVDYLLNVSVYKSELYRSKDDSKVYTSDVKNWNASPEPRVYLSNTLITTGYTVGATASGYGKVTFTAVPSGIVMCSFNFKYLTDTEIESYITDALKNAELEFLAGVGAFVYGSLSLSGHPIEYFSKKAAVKILSMFLISSSFRHFNFKVGDASFNKSQIVASIRQTIAGLNEEIAMDSIQK